MPYTPDSDLALAVRKVVQEEGDRLGLKVKVVEGGGVSLSKVLATKDLKAGEPCTQPDCPLFLSGEPGGLHHHRAGAVYTGECLICEEKSGGEKVGKYWGETGDSGYCFHNSDSHAVQDKTKPLKSKKNSNLSEIHLDFSENFLETFKIIWKVLSAE